MSMARKDDRSDAVTSPGDAAVLALTHPKVIS